MQTGIMFWLHKSNNFSCLGVTARSRWKEEVGDVQLISICMFKFDIGGKRRDSFILLLLLPSAYFVTIWPPRNIL